MTEERDQAFQAALLRSTERETVPLSASERAAIGASKRAAARGEFATNTEVKAIWAKYGL
jgi:predicted transcriptional regulator